MLITAIVALGSNRVIGKDGKLPWHLPADLKRFKQTTMGHHIIMGRKTWDALPDGPLPGRVNVVVSRTARTFPEGVKVFPSLDAALEWVFREMEEEVFIIGGAQIYQTAMPMLDRMVLTEVDASPDGDAWFPEWREGEWDEVSRETCPADERNPHAFDLVVMERRKKRKEGHHPWRGFDY